MDKLIKDKNHSHYWIEDGLLYESYRTLRGVRYRDILNVNGLSDDCNCSESVIKHIEDNYLNRKQFST